jgi:histidinol-phosphatase (PHP family)
MGGEILINSDAHQKELLNGGFDIAARTAVECGFTHTLFLEHGESGKVQFRHVPLDIPAET